MDIIQKIAEGIAGFPTDIDVLGDAYEYLIGQFAAGSGKKAGEFYTPQQISTILSEIVVLDSQEPKTGKKKKLDKVLDFACGSGSLLLNVHKHMGANSIGKIYGQEKNITTYNLARMNMLLHGVKDIVGTIIFYSMRERQLIAILQPIAPTSSPTGSNTFVVRPCFHFSHRIFLEIFSSPS